MSKETGVCKWFDAKKGIGFVTPDSGDADIFVHQSAIQSEGFRKLVEDEKVEYDVDTDDSGRKKAINVISQGAPEGGKGRGRGGGRGGGGGGRGSNVCFAFQKGECTRGDECRFSHVLA